MKRVAILNSESLIGAEIKEALGRRPDLGLEIRLLTTISEEVGMVTEGAEGAAFLHELSNDSTGDLDLLIHCPGPAGISRSEIPADLTVVRVSSSSPLPEGIPLVSGINLDALKPGSDLVSPHPGVIALAHLLHPLLAFGLESAACWCLLPSSIRGQAGLDELLGQTRAILSFSAERPQTVFGTQLAFNLLPADVSGAELGLQIGRLLDLEVPPALHALQAGLFHGLAAGGHVRLKKEPELAEVREELLSQGFLTAPDDPLEVGPIVAAGRSQAILSGLESLPGSPGGYSLWMVMDNLTLGGSENVVAIVEALAAARH